VLIAIIVGRRGVKRHVVGKKCIRHYAGDRVLVSFGDASELLSYNSTKTLCEGWRYKVVQVSL